MANVKIYGAARSRAGRNLWCARELGLPVEHVDIGGPQTKEPSYLAINPAGKIPALIDGEHTMTESLAINMYLAKKHSLGQLYPTKPEDEAKMWQWTLWAASEVDPSLGLIMGPRLFNRGELAQADAAEAKLQNAFKYLDNALAGREWLIGNSFSVADINVGTVMDGFQRSKVDFSNYPNLTAWLSRITSRPAAKAA